MEKRLIIYVTLFIVLAIFTGCEKTAINGDQGNESVRFTSFRDVPGVTEEEIKAIEVLVNRGASFVFANLEGTEAFYNKYGEIRGFSALLCEWLSGLFDMRFEPSICEWSDLLGKLESGEIDFTGELTANDERRKTYFMTDAIADRQIITIRIANSPPLALTATQRPLRYAFLSGATTFADVSMHSKNQFEAFFADTYEEAYSMLLNFEVDAFFEENTAEVAFEHYPNLVFESFLPLILSPVSLSTQNPENEPIISIVQKILHNDGIQYLTELYNLGEYEYRKDRLLMRLSEAEQSYIESSPVVKFAAENDNYPNSFFNNHVREFQGISLDVLKEVELLTGIRFEIANNEKDDWSHILKMLEDGDADMISELLSTPERQGHFLWPQTALITDYHALLSKSEYPNIKISEILYTKVGLVDGYGHTEIFKLWFPNHKYSVIYENFDLAISALDRGEVNLVMSSRNQLLVLTHFMERTGYKANITFDYPYTSTFGFNKDKTVLCSIVDKVLSIIDMGRISDQWTQRTFDYQRLAVRQQRPWLIGSSVMLLFIIILLVILFLRAYRARVRLAVLHKEVLEINEASNRFVPTQFVKKIGVENITKLRLGDSVQSIITVMFYDIRFFSVHSQMMSINETFDLVNRVFSLAGKVVQKHNGFVDKYLGDSAMILFEHAGDAVKAGIEIYRTLINEESTRIKSGMDGIKIGIGAHTGNVMMGVIGDSEHYASTVISKHVNTASRIEGLTKQLNAGMLISADVMQSIPENEQTFSFRYLGLVNPSGSRETIGIFEILDVLPDDTKKQRLETYELFESAIRNFHTENYKVSAERFLKVTEIDPTDKCAKHFYNEAVARVEGRDKRNVFSFAVK